MKNIKLNTEIQEIELAISNVSIADLEKRGWDFDQYGTNRENCHNDHFDNGLVDSKTDHETEMKWLRENCDITLFIRKEEDAEFPTVNFEFVEDKSNGNYERYGEDPSGDDESAISDICEMLSAGEIDLSDDISEIFLQS